MTHREQGVAALVPSVDRAAARPQNSQPLGLEAVQPGDLFFGARPSPLQLLCQISGESWRHVGMVQAFDGRLYVVEGGRKGLQRRPLATAASRYSRVGIARVQPEHEQAAVEAVRWASAAEQGSYAFPMAVACYAGWCSFARLRLRVSPRLLLQSPFRTYASRLDRQDNVATCSHLVLQALDRSGVDISVPAEEAVGDLPMSMASLVTPGDIWRLPVCANRYAVVPPSDSPGAPPLTWLSATIGFIKGLLPIK